jgi:hypothetical protein
MIGGGELRQPESIVLHRRSGLPFVLPRDVEGQPEGREHPEQYQQQEPDAEAREGQTSHERYSTRRDFKAEIVVPRL